MQLDPFLWGGGGRGGGAKREAESFTEEKVDGETKQRGDSLRAAFCFCL